MYLYVGMHLHADLYVCVWRLQAMYPSVFIDANEERMADDGDAGDDSDSALLISRKRRPTKMSTQVPEVFDKVPRDSDVFMSAMLL